VLCIQAEREGALWTSRIRSVLQWWSTPRIETGKRLGTMFVPLRVRGGSVGRATLSSVRCYSGQLQLITLPASLGTISCAVIP
jgi:hypothetical protein